jgi:hypothetical protein
MARSKTWKAASDKRDAGGFRTLPVSVIEGRAYLSCSPYAIKLLIDFLLQYRGNNNGDLACAWSMMRARGWKSEATLSKAKRELIACKLIQEARMGARPNKCSLYALTFFDLDESPKLEITRKSFQRGGYKLMEPIALKVPPNVTHRPLNNATLTTPGVVDGAG